MKKLLWFLLGFFFFSCSGQKTDLTVVVAANMAHAIEDIVTAFEEERSVKIDVILGSSGKLYAQIIEGAPFDVFVSADMDYPMGVYTNGRAASKPEIYARGRLVIYTAVAGLDSGNVLTSQEVEKIAIANPKTAPYGRAALQYLQNANYHNQINSKLVYGESIGQTNQFLSTGAAQAGITSLSSVVFGELSKKGKFYILDPAWYDPIDQGVVVLSHNSDTQELGRIFKEFLLSEKAQDILAMHGYLKVNE